jgi:hypothetical protein
MTDLSSFTIVLDVNGIAIMFCLFMTAIYLNYRLGYYDGLEKAHLFGIYETVEFLMKNSGLSGINAETGEQASVKDMTIQIAAELAQQRNQQEQSTSC